MRTFFVLLEREIRSFFHTPIAYVVMFFFLAVLGFGFHAGVIALNRHPSYPVSVIEMMFVYSPFIMTYMLCVSLISMRAFTDEFRMGTLETLTTAPVRDWQVVLSKFAGIVAFYIVLLMPTALFFVILRWISGGTTSIASVGAFGSVYLILLLAGMFFISFGCLASALVKDQINAAVITFALIAVYIVLTSFMTDEVFVSSQEIRSVGGYVNFLQHLKDACVGRLDTQQLVLYPSLTILNLFATLQIFQFRKWKA